MKQNKNKPVVLVHNEASDATVLFETAVGPQAVLTGDNTQNGDIDSVNELDVYNQPFEYV